MPEVRCSNCNYAFSIAQFLLERAGLANLDCPSCRIVGKVVLVIQESPSPQAKAALEKEYEGLSVREVVEAVSSETPVSGGHDVPGTPDAEALTSDESPASPEEPQQPYATVTAVDPQDPSKGNRPVRRKRATTTSGS